jgi:hypothetical protein
MGDLIGVIWSLAITRKLNAGYALVVKSDRVIGINKGAWGWNSSSTAYLGPGSKATESDRQAAEEVVAELLQKVDFDVPKSEISKISYRAPGLFSNGRVVIKGTSGDIELRLARLTPDIGVRLVIKSLLPSLVDFAADRVYDEKTGRLVAAEVKETGKLPS